MSRDYDLAIIGGGSAGLTGAGLAVQLGARVALVEKHRVGGDCTWTGCVPSKTLLKAAKVAQEMRTADVHGLGAVEPTVDFKRVMDHVRAVVSDVYHNESPESLSSDGIDVFIGAARFRDSHTLSVGDTTIRARKLLLVTGAHPLVPSVPGLDDVSYLTYENVWDLDALPRRLLVVGGGPIGCEMAQAFRRLGSQVTLVEAAERLLLQDTPQASRVIAERFADEGITLRFNAPLQRARQDGEGIHVVAGDEEMVADQVFVAVGRRPNVKSLDLEIAGVSYSDRGIMVDSRLRTSKRHIYAAGDCTGGFQFTHYAGWQGFMAVRNARGYGNRCVNNIMRRPPQR